VIADAIAIQEIEESRLALALRAAGMPAIHPAEKKSSDLYVFPR
jgi:hypothetical protein